jgi:hypothetical protein
MSLNTQQARLALAGANFVLTLAVLGLGYVTFLTRREPPADSRVPKYEPTKLALPAQAKAADPFQEYEVVWKQLDKPLPPPAPPPPPPDPKPVKEDLAQRFRATLFALATTDGPHYVILEPRSGGGGDSSMIITAGENLPVPYAQYKCTNIELKVEGSSKRCIVTLQDAQGQASPIELRVEESK